MLLEKEVLDYLERRSRLTWLKFIDKQKNSVKEYEYVVEIWHKFEMKSMKDYHDLYLEWDVSLLAKVFEKTESSSFKKLWTMSEILFECTSLKLWFNA